MEEFREWDYKELQKENEKLKCAYIKLAKYVKDGFEIKLIPAIDNFLKELPLELEGMKSSKDKDEIF